MKRVLALTACLSSELVRSDKLSNYRKYRSSLLYKVTDSISQFAFTTSHFITTAVIRQASAVLNIYISASTFTIPYPFPDSM